MSGTGTSVDGSVSAEISNALVKLVREYTGRGPTKARTSIRDDTVVVLLQDSLLKAEHQLVQRGKTDLVLQMRHEFQRAMRPAMTAVVEGALGRKVIAFMSDNHIDPDMAVEVFVLEPE
jgi:uncharacterized protein YbcI